MYILVIEISLQWDDHSIGVFLCINSGALFSNVEWNTHEYWWHVLLYLKYMFLHLLTRIYMYVHDVNIGQYFVNWLSFKLRFRWRCVQNIHLRSNTHWTVCIYTVSWCWGLFVVMWGWSFLYKWWVYSYIIYRW